MSNNDNVISLFAGAGGFSYGFTMSGLKPLFGAEINKDACATYEENIKSTCHKIDLSEIEPRVIKNLLGGQSPFAIIGGPPCQGFSSAGVRNPEDPRNALIFNYLNIVEEVSPRWFIFENVEGILTSGSSYDLPMLVEEFIKIGYFVRVEKINLAGYGLPQTRKRVFIIGNKMGLDFDFPSQKFSFNSGKAKSKSDLPFAPSLIDAISGLGVASNIKGGMVPYPQSFAVNQYDELMRLGNVKECVSLHYDLTNPEDAFRHSMLKAGQTMKDLPPEYWHSSYKKRANRRVSDGMPSEKRGGAPAGIKRLHKELQCLTITGAASREFIHPVFDRPLTMRECARVQSFPDTYEFTGNSLSIIQQIGNAVPPTAASIFAEHLKKLDGIIGAGNSNARFLSRPKLLGYNLTDATGMSPALKKTDGFLSQLLTY
ncbi:DNA cytosine methyltransferase [Enterobacter asburiae]|nr:DNA cytosine methyltransferase [Enterobacter asburiae]